MISPREINPPMIKTLLKKEKSLLEVRATPVSPMNSMKVINPACGMRLMLSVLFTAI